MVHVYTRKSKYADNDLNRAPGMWCVGWAWPYESAFGLLQKFAWVNALSCCQIARHALFADYHWSYGSTELVLGDWITRRHRAGRLPDGFPLREGLLSHYAWFWSERLGSTEAVRFCPVCLDSGYHSIFHQLSGIERCPIHDQMLLENCRHCGRATGTFSLRRGDSKTPFQCMYCEQPLSNNFDPNLWVATEDMHVLVKDCMNPIVVWLADLELRYPPTNLHEAPLKQLNCLTTGYWDSDSATMFDVARQLVVLRLPEYYLHKLKRPVRYVRVKRHPASSGAATPLQQISDRTKIYKAIRRYLVRTFLGNHRYCLSHAAQTTRVERVYGQLVVVPDVAACPVAGALVHWSLGSAPKLESEFQNGGNELGLPRRLYGDEHSLWAQLLLAKFYYCCASSLVRMAIFHAESRDEVIPGDVRLEVFWFSTLL